MSSPAESEAVAKQARASAACPSARLLSESAYAEWSARGLDFVPTLQERLAHRHP